MVKSGTVSVMVVNHIKLKFYRAKGKRRGKKLRPRKSFGVQKQNQENEEVQTDNKNFLAREDPILVKLLSLTSLLFETNIKENPCDPIFAKNIKRLPLYITLYTKHNELHCN